MLSSFSDILELHHIKGIKKCFISLPVDMVVESNTFYWPTSQEGIVCVRLIDGATILLSHGYDASVLQLIRCVYADRQFIERNTDNLYFAHLVGTSTDIKPKG